MNTEQYVATNGETTGLGFQNRDQNISNLEQEGHIDFLTIWNNKERENMRMLIDLKNIFSRQLPKMPREYIVKLVFDRYHESLVIAKNNPNGSKKIIGGICYRVYQQKQFAEIAFLAVTAQEQVRGFGTRLMNQYKQKMQERQVKYLLTYADNFAIGYFKKQGFSKEHELTQEDWKGYIKDYDGGTFMECYVNPLIDYVNISAIIQQQKALVIQHLLTLTANQATIYHNTLTKQNYQDIQANIDLIPELIPGLVQAGWTKQDYIELKKTKERSFYMSCKDILDELFNHKSSWPFKEPVNKEEVADYFDIIKNPMDLSTMSQKLQQNQYNSKQEFENDLNLIFDNCRQYNQPETIYYKSATQLQTFIKPYVEKLKDDKNHNNTIMEVENNSHKKKKKKL